MGVCALLNASRISISHSSATLAFKDNVIQWADAYWVSANILYYVTPDHQQRAAPLDRVDRTLSE
jgi:hypothetical protein